MRDRYASTVSIAIALAIAAALGAVALREAGRGRSTSVGAAAFVPAVPADETSTATVEPAGDKADLVIGWWYDFDFDHCIRPGQQRVLTVLVENIGLATAGAFNVRAANVAWHVDGLGVGERERRLLTSPLYPVWPLVVDADDEVAESDETNNSAGPSADATWTPTIVSTLPPECTGTPDRPTPSVTATTTGTPPPPLPDLVILGLGWGPDRPVPTCARYAVPWFGFVTIANQGAASAGPFSVRAPRVSWAVDGLAEGETRVLVSPPWVYPDVPIVADPDNAVAESDETNNAYDPDPNHLWTATPVMTSPAPCTPTPTAAAPKPKLFLPWTARNTLPAPPDFAHAPPTAGRWSSTGSPAAHPIDATATKLLDGRVLLVGGIDDGTAAQLYDPAGARFSATANPAIPRGHHTATLLRDGTVLIVGGFGANGATTSAERYDPRTDTWRPVGTLNTARAAHAAALLGDGRVLVVGGQEAAQTAPLSSAEIYDPSTDRWTITGSLTFRRSSHTATTLPDGRVLVVGGEEWSDFVIPGPYALDQSEIYDPAVGTWALAGQTRLLGTGYTPYLLPNGRVLVVGSIAEIFDPATSAWRLTGQPLASRYHYIAAPTGDGRILYAGGGRQGSTELYDPRLGTWSRGDDMNTPRSDAVGAGLDDGTVLIVGGHGNRYYDPPTAEVFDPFRPSKRGLWHVAAAPTVLRARHSVTRLADGRMLIAGGIANGLYRSIDRDSNNDWSAVASAELYDPIADRWRRTAPMIERRVDHAAVRLADGRVLVVGGTNSLDGGEPYRSAEIFDPSTERWTAAGSLDCEDIVTATRLSDDRVLVVGDDCAGLFDPPSGRWRPANPPLFRHSVHAASLLADGTVLIVGNVWTDRAETYDPRTGAWTATGSTHLFGERMAVARLTDGRVLAAGGGFSDDPPERNASLYDPITRTWESVAPMSQPRAGAQAAVLSSGRVLVVGGNVRPWNDKSDVTTAELFDPATETWTMAAYPHAWLEGHTLTELADGDVIAIGGEYGSGAERFTEDREVRPIVNRLLLPLLP